MHIVQKKQSNASFFYSTNNKKNVIIITIDGVDNMREAYFEQEEKRIQEKIDLARLGMFAALEFVEFKEKNTERAKRNIEVIISKMIAAPDYQGKQNKRSLLVKKLKDERKTTSLVSLSKVMDRVENMVESRYRIHWAEAESYSASSQHHDALFKISTSISGNPVDALIEYSSMYTQAIYRREQLKKERSDALKEEAEKNRRRQELHDRTEAQSGPVYTPRYDEPVGYSAPNQHLDRLISEEEIQKEIDQKLQHGDEYLDYDLARNIEKKYKNLDQQDYYGDFYDSDNIKDIYKFYVVSNKPLYTTATMNYGKMVELGTLAVELVFKDLMNGYRDSNTKMARFIHQFDPHGTLARYEKARERYLRYYDRLSPKEKEQVDKYAAKFDEYRELFGFQNTSGRAIASVDDIKRVVNYRVKIEYADHGEYNKYYRNNGEFDDTFQRNLEYATKYMSVAELRDLYHAVKYREMENQRYAMRGAEDQPRVAEIQQKRYAEIQRAFAEAIRSRLTNSTMTIEEMNDEQAKERFMIRREKDLVAIVHDIFQEEPLFPLYRVKADTVEPGYGNSRVETAETLSTARRKYYGLGKLEQVLATLRLNKLEELGKKDTLTVEETAKVKKLF